MSVLYVYPGKLRGHGLDLVARQHLRAFSEAGISVECLARGAVDLPGVVSRTLRYTPANAISFLPAAYYYGAQSRFFGAWAERVLDPAHHRLVVAFEGSAERVFLKARGSAVATALICPLGHIRQGEATRERAWPSIGPRRLEAEYHAADRIIVRSPRAADTFTVRGVGQDRMVVVPGGVDETLFYPSEERTGEPFRLLFCGRLSERKGIRQVIEAWKLAGLPAGTAELWLVGAEPNELKQWLDMNCGPNVHRMGFVKDVAAVMRRCDAQILLSEAEGMPKSLVEGACSGLATLATPETGFPVRDGVTGWTVGRHDVRGVAEAIRRLAQDRELTRRQGAEARRDVLKHYTWSAFRRAFIAGLRPLLPDNP
jgi:glycosyltransferase involved in cell wall biosynthesis